MPDRQGKSSWAAPAVRKRSVREDGVAEVVVDLSDAQGLQGTARLTVTPEGVLLVEWTRAPGGRPLRGFQAWERTA